VNRRFEITDDEWERLAPLLPPIRPRRGGRWRHHRQVLNGILIRMRTGIAWRDLPERYGPWQTVYKRFARWQTDGSWARIEAALHTQAVAAGELDWHAQIESTVVRAHQHAVASGSGSPFYIFLLRQFFSACHASCSRPPASTAPVTCSCSGGSRCR
jgi:transposase